MRVRAHTTGYQLGTAPQARPKVVTEPPRRISRQDDPGRVATNVPERHASNEPKLQAIKRPPARVILVIWRRKALEVGLGEHRSTGRSVANSGPR